MKIVKLDLKCSIWQYIISFWKSNDKVTNKS
jgi:hypothetical protein